MAGDIDPADQREAAQDLALTGTGQRLDNADVLLRDGRIKYREDVVEELENAPRGLIGLLRGENAGKRIVRVGPDDNRSAP